MLVIRLTRVGKKNSPAFRIVVADKRKAVKRKFIEIIGHYNPSINPKQLVVNKERATYWLGQGAQPSDTVNNLLCREGVLAKEKMVKVVYGKATKKKDAGKEKTEATVAPTESTSDETPETENTEVAPDETADEVETETAAEPEKTAEAKTEEASE